MALQRQKELFQGQREGEGIAAGSKPMPGHVRNGIQRLRFSRPLLDIVRKARHHGHANQRRDTCTSARGFHHRHLLFDQALLRVSRPHVIC